MAKKPVVDRKGDLQALSRERARKHSDIIHFYAMQWEAHTHRGKLLENIRICPPKYTGDKWLIVLKAWEGDTQYVAFYRGGSLLGSLAGAFTALSAGTLSWKEDAFARKALGE